MGIRWSKGDYIRLGKAVADFNRQVTQNTTEANKLYLPKLVDYNALKNEIKTRQGLNAYIQQLKRINLEGSLELEQLEGGVVLSRYQRRELQRSLATVIPKLEADIAKVEAQTLASYGYSKGTKLPDMLKGVPQKQLEARLKDYKDLFTLSGEKFRNLASKLMVNQTEKKYRQAYLFRQRYMKEMREKYSNFRDYWIFKKYYADKHKDPVRFYDDLPEDDTYCPNDLYFQSDKTFTEEAFTSFVETILGVSVDEIYEKEGLKKNISGEDLKVQKTIEAEKRKDQAAARLVNKKLF